MTYFTRRTFITNIAASGAMMLISRKTAFAGSLPPHPEPRPGITAAQVLSADKLGADKKLIQLFDGVRKIPEVMDGIRCNCGCPNPPEYRSLLSCFEGRGMARDCVICQGQARLAIRLHGEGKSLSEIRQAVDAKFA
jgi:hypothetical protein